MEEDQPRQGRYEVSFEELNRLHVRQGLDADLPEHLRGKPRAIRRTTAKWTFYDRNGKVTDVCPYDRPLQQKA